ncbi:MAG: AAA family ATPase [Eubacterium sp.]|nr:AAA family ATPase [Eubacterium sp.]
MAIINAPAISTGKLVKTVSNYYMRMRETGISCQDIRPIMLFGPTGVGKSAAVEEIAEFMEKESGKKIKVVDIRLTSCTITDLIGIPSPDKDRTKTIWLKPEIYEAEEGYDEYIYFFDEIDKANPSVQAAALQLILDRKAWTHHFPENTYVIAAANPARNTKKYETRMSPELMNRFKHFNVQPDYESFRIWGIGQKIHYAVLGYLSYDQSKLYAASESEDVAFPTPRAWKSVSDTLNAFEDVCKDIREIHFDLAGELGTGVALEFESWFAVYSHMPVIKNIVEGTETIYPKTMDVMHALIASLTAYVVSKGDKIRPEELRNAIIYVSRFPVDFATLFFKNLLEIDGMNLLLMKVPEYVAWAKKNRI